MKKLIVLVSMIGMVGCDPEECTEHILSNKTNQDINVLRYSSAAAASPADEFFIKSNSSEEVGKVKCSKGGVVVSYGSYDSVVVESSNGLRLKTYYPNSTGKNIYDVEEDWVVEKLGKRSKRYTFEITEADILISDTEE